MANNSSDMVVDISGAATGTPVTVNGEQYTSPNLTRDAVIDTVASAGDRLLDFKAIAMHSTVYRNLAKQDAITFIRTSDQNYDMPTVFGMACIVDDNLSLPGGAFLNVIFKQGSVGFAEGPGHIPVEIFRWPSQGNCAGVEELHSRRNSIIHVNGFSFTSASVALQSPSCADLATAANWTRVVPRKNVPLAFLVTNWMKVARDGTHAKGDEANPANWYGYGADVLAVADATVAVAMDDIPDPQTVEPQKVVEIQNASGNYIVLSLGNGKFAFYEHLKSGSIRVRAGKRMCC